ncbi:MAG: glycosyltransferase [Candidatus Diapherotrites archaeon]|nr:glycosyltransferase [Candidatus Diapherotrites archaeon]
MKIAMFTETFLPQVNGVVTSISSFSEELTRQGHKVEIFAPAPGDKEFNGIKVHRFRSLTFRPYPEFRAALPPVGINKHIKGKGFDIIHTHGPFALGWAGWWIAMRNKLPLVSTFHTPISDYVEYLSKDKNVISLGKKLAWLYAARYYNRCTHMITPSEVIRKLVRSNGVRVPISIIPTGIRLDDFEGMADSSYVREKFQIDGRFVFHAGRLSFEKNVDDIIRAMPLVLKKHPRLKLVIASKGPAMGQLKQLTKQLGLDKNVVFTGYVEQKDLIALYKEAELAVIASGAETQGLVITEAMACGTPVIGANALAIPEVINNQNGFLFELHKSKELAEKIIKLLSNDKLRKKLAKNARKTAERSTIEESTKKLVKLYAGLRENS